MLSPDLAQHEDLLSHFPILGVRRAGTEVPDEPEATAATGTPGYQLRFRFAQSAGSFAADQLRTPPRYQCMLV